MADDSPGTEPLRAEPRVDSTADLLIRARDGEDRALNQLFERYEPVLRRWAHGRLSAAMRDLRDTDDLVQETLIQAFTHLEQFEYRWEGAFLAYLRMILWNQIRQAARKSKVRPHGEPIADRHIDSGQTPLEIIIWTEMMEHYETALLELSVDQREAVIMRIEFGHSYESIARELARPSANSVRMLIVRALARVARSMELMRGEPDRKR
jgi:RNA polymerase sigma-70 factor, ECF subfamily